jgi:ABC-type uncharacterized transport system permease subunit
MRNIIIGFSRPRAFLKPFSWAIRLVEKTPYSHVYIRSYSETLGVDLIYQASGAQVNFMGLDIFKSHVVIVKEFSIDIPDEKYKEFMRWAIINSGAPYSIKQPLGILLIKLFNLKRNPLQNGRAAWICSELVAFVLSAFLGVDINMNYFETLGPKGVFEICKKHFNEVRT